METYTVFSPRVAAQLRNKGYEIVRTEANEFKPTKDAYIFKVVPGFMDDFHDVCNQYSRRK